jgi:uncharacterized membrane protein YtjA (UPF0391 family)
MGNLLYWAIILIIIAIIAAFFGLGGVSGVASGGAQLLIYVAIALVVIGGLLALARRR